MQSIRQAFIFGLNFVLCGLIIHNVDGQTCPGLEYFGACFWLVSTPTSWPLADEGCDRAGGQLASVNSPGQSGVIRDLMVRAGATSVWIGASRQQNVWQWERIQGVVGPQGCYADKLKEEDKDLVFRVDIPELTPEKCIDACGARGYLYAGTQAGIYCYCDNDFGAYGTGTSCTVKCSGTGSRITQWCGGYITNSIYRTVGYYAKWGYNQPNNHKQNQNCGIMDMALESKMADEMCMRNASFFCEIFVSEASCTGQGYHFRDGTCYYLNETQITWDEARTQCILRTGDLVTIDTELKHNITKKLANDVFPIAEKIWIGLRKGTGWRWVGGYIPYTYTDWAQDYPTAANNSCVHITSSSGYHWQNTDCSVRAHYVCQQGQVIGDNTGGGNGGGNGGGTASPTTASGNGGGNGNGGGGNGNGGGGNGNGGGGNGNGGGGNGNGGGGNGNGGDGNDTTSSSAGDPVTTTAPIAAPTKAGQSGQTQDEMSTLQIVLYTLLAILLLVILILAIILLVKFCNKKRTKVSDSFIKSYDARPIAPRPNSGFVPDYDSYASTLDLRKGGPW